MDLKLYVLIISLHAIAADTSFPSRSTPRPTRQTPLDVQPQILHLAPHSFDTLLPPIQSEDQPSAQNIHSVGLPPSNLDFTGPLVRSLGTGTPNPFELSHQSFSTPPTSGHAVLPALQSSLPNPGPINLTPVFVGSPSSLQAENRIFGLNSLFPLLSTPFNLGSGGPLAIFPNKLPSTSSGDSVSITYPTTELATSILTFPFGTNFPPFLGNKNKKGSFRNSLEPHLPSISTLSLGNAGGMFSSPQPSTFISASAPMPQTSPAYVYPLSDKIFMEPKYDFHYAVNNQYPRNNFAHQESRRGPDTHGHYEVLLPDGRLQRVRYSVEGDGGYVAHVTYEDI